MVGCSDDGENGMDKNNLGGKLHTNIALPEFSRENLHAQLELLADAFESQGHDVRSSLLPGIGEERLQELCSWFPGNLPEELVALYQWSGGQEKDAWEEEFPFLFRDNSFCSIERARFEYENMMMSYGAYPENREMLKFSFPFASFNGAWYVIPTNGHNLKSAIARPIISVLQSIDVYFYSMEKMVQTCIEWVSHENYSENGLYPQEVESAIWEKHNPGVFSAQI